MDIEEIRADIFKLFNLKVDRDDPIWAFLYANREIVRNLEETLEINKKENRETHKQLKADLDEFKTAVKDTIYQVIEQFDFKIDEFNREMLRVERIQSDFTSYQSRFKADMHKIFEDHLEKLSELFDSNMLSIEERMNHIIEAVDYSRFSNNIEREVEEVVKRSLQEIKAGVAINNKAMEKINKLNEEHEAAIYRLNSQISTITTLGVFQAILFGASLTLVGLIYFSQGTPITSFGDNQNKTQIENVVTTRASTSNSEVRY